MHVHHFVSNFEAGAATGIYANTQNTHFKIRQNVDALFGVSEHVQGCVFEDVCSIHMHLHHLYSILRQNHNRDLCEHPKHKLQKSTGRSMHF